MVQLCRVVLSSIAMPRQDMNARPISLDGFACLALKVRTTTSARSNRASIGRRQICRIRQEQEGPYEGGGRRVGSHLSTAKNMHP